jgi:hypothetical protein
VKAVIFGKLVQYRCDYEVRVGFKETVGVRTVGIIVAFRQRAEPCPLLLEVGRGCVLGFLGACAATPPLACYKT